jgi:hypothetical protein
LTQQGVYVFQLSAPLARIADFNTLVPGENTTFLGFGNVAIDPSHVVFEAFQPGWRSYCGRPLHKSDRYTHKARRHRRHDQWQSLTAINFGSRSFSGNQVVFETEFSDGSQSIALATVIGNRCPQSQGFWKNHTALWPQGFADTGQPELFAV